jgi:hypothetical protein
MTLEVAPFQQFVCVDETGLTSWGIKELQRFSHRGGSAIGISAGIVVNNKHAVSPRACLEQLILLVS